MKLLITGSRKATLAEDYERLKIAIEKYEPNATEILHGGAIGADQLVSKYATESGLRETIIRPDYESYPSKLAPLMRNTILVEKCDGCIAYYKGKPGGGTLDTARKAQKAGKLIVEILDDQERRPAKQLSLL